MEKFWNQIKILGLTISMGTGEEQVEHSYAVGITVVKLFSIYIFNRYIYEPDNSHFNQRCKKLINS